MMRAGLKRPFRRLSDRYGSSVSLGGIDYFDENPGADWLPADGGAVDYSPALAAILTPDPASFTTEAVAGGIDTAFGNGVYVMIGGNGRVWRSFDLLTWTGGAIAAIGENCLLNEIEFANGQFVVVGSTGAGQNGRSVFTSVDGVTWVKRIYNSTPLSFLAIAFGRGCFVAVSGDGKIYRSTDGWTFVEATRPATHTDASYQTVRFIEGQFFAAGSHRSIAVSSDGLTFSSVSYSSGSSVAYLSICYGRGLWLVAYANVVQFGGALTSLTEDVTLSSTAPVNSMIFDGRGLWAATNDYVYQAGEPRALRSLGTVSGAQKLRVLNSKVILPGNGVTASTRRLLKPRPSFSLMTTKAKPYVKVA